MIIVFLQYFSIQKLELHLKIPLKERTKYLAVVMRKPAYLFKKKANFSDLPFYNVYTKAINKGDKQMKAPKSWKKYYGSGMT